MTIGVIGSGSWGSALVKILTDNQHQVIWCVRSEKLAEHIRTRHHNPKYLSSVYFDNKKLSITTDPAMVYAQAEAVVMAVPSAYAEEGFVVLGGSVGGYIAYVGKYYNDLGEST